MQPTNRALAEKLAYLIGAEHQFTSLARDLAGNWYRAASARGTVIERSLTEDRHRIGAFESRVRQFEKALRVHFPRYLETVIDLIQENIDENDLCEFVEALSDERVRRFFIRIDQIRDDAMFRIRALKEEIVRESLSAADLNAPRVGINAILQSTNREWPV